MLQPCCNRPWNRLFLKARVSCFKYLECRSLKPTSPENLSIWPSCTGSDFVYFHTMDVSLINPPSTLTKFALSSVRPFRCNTLGSFENVKYVFPAADGPRTKTQIRDRNETVPVVVHVVVYEYLCGWFETFYEFRGSDFHDILLESDSLRCLRSRSFNEGSIMWFTSTSTSVLLVVVFLPSHFEAFVSSHSRHLKHFQVFFLICGVFDDSS